MLDNNIAGYLPCICGGKARLVVCGVGSYVRCPECDAATYMCTTGEDALQKWKERQEKTMKEDNQKIVYIGLDQIYPHPDNPRKNLGDLEELADSIRKNGVMQNLTVVPGHWITDEEYYEICGKFSQDPSEGLRKIMNKRWMPDGYTLIIGHRRCAAARQAGLEKVPCRIVEDMDKKDQVGTMLEENMQRNDLTVYEQAQGFQMMLDLGETEETIADKTGFSRTTVRRRLNIAKLDQKELQKKEQDESFQMSLKDLYALEQVEDIKTRNKILKEASSSRDLIWRAQQAAADAERDKKKDQIIKLLEKAGIRKAPAAAENERYSGKWEVIKDYDLDKGVPKQIKLPKKEGTIYYLCLPYYRRVSVITKAAKKPETEWEKARKEQKKREKEIDARMKALNARRHDFIANIISGKIEPVKEEAEIREAVWRALMQSGGVYLSESSMRKFFTGKEDYNCASEEIEDANKKFRDCSFLHQMLTVLNYKIDNNGNMYDYNGKYNDNRGEFMLQCYRILARYGWTFEDDEELLLNGTHELYTKETEQS